MPQPYKPVVKGNHMVPEPPKDQQKPASFSFKKKDDQTPRKQLKDAKK